MYLIKERELTRARKLLENKEKQYNALKNAYQTWEQDILILWDTATELGLVTNSEDMASDEKCKILKELNEAFNIGNLGCWMERPDYKYTNDKFLEAQEFEEKHQQEVDSINRKIRSYKGLNKNS
ncbi:hypothetical protein [Xenorhabdus bovienii]|uniref:hypothetical protein n=1 Tax=Xenorhabdus bovienii TaxID=40576 RepID=UPI003DA474AB